MPIPVRPAAHYHMGGVVTDALGRTNIKGLWACGEVANTGLHGANRLASNSLLEAASFGQAVAEDILGVITRKWIRAYEEPVLYAKADVSANDRNKIRYIMAQHVGVLRDQVKLFAAVSSLTPLAMKSDMALVALMIATSALQRKESRGAHARTDYQSSLATAKRSKLSLIDIFPEGMAYEARASA